MKAKKVNESLNEALPRGIFDDPANTKAFKSWTNVRKVEYTITTSEPINIVSDDEVEVAKLRMIFNKYRIKYHVSEIDKN